jgi:integrase
MLVDLRQGVDPKARAMTLQLALESYLKKVPLSDSSCSSYRRDVEVHFADWASKPLNFITREMVEKRHLSIAKRIKDANKGSGKTSANAAMRTLRLLWNYVGDTDATLPANPVRLKRQWFEETRRDRIVEEHQMPAFYSAVLALESDVARDYLLFVMFTGLRRREAAKLKWAHVDFDAKLVRIPADNTKAKRKLDLPMSDFVRNLLVARRSMGRELSDYVFPSHGKKTGYIAEPRAPLDAIHKATAVRVSVHDLRRTYITVAEQAEISPMALKALVNHSLGNDVTEGYVRMRSERLRAPAQRVADLFQCMCGAPRQTNENVLSLA